LNGDDTIYGAEGRWGDCNNVRFRLGRPQIIGGWESLVSTLLTGVCRAVFPWTDNAAILNIAFGTHSKVQLWQGGALFDITPFGPPTPLGTDPLATTNTTARIDVHHVAHGYTTGLSLKIFGAATVATVVPNGTFTITVDDADHYHYTAGSNANATVAAGGGSGIVVTPQTALPAGATDGTGSVGFGTGGYGGGPWGETPATADYFPRTWSFDAWGQVLAGSPRNGGLYAWGNNTAARMAAVDGAPTQITHMLVAPMQGGYMLFALGCNQEADGVFNPRAIRHSAIRDYNSWSTLTSTSREYVLPGSGRIVAGRMCGPYLLVWTSDELFLGTYTGALDRPWDFTRVGLSCGLIGPNAVIVVGQTAFWVSPDRQFHSYGVGGAPAVLPCPIRTDFAENLAAVQGDKIVASANAEFSEIRFDYPDKREGFENSRYVAMELSGIDAGAWYRGIMDRTAYVDAGPSLFPVGVSSTGAAYYHETGFSADAGAFAWSIRTAAQLLDPEYRLQINGVWPDFRDQMGPITVTVSSREHPQGLDTVTAGVPMAPDDMKADILITGRLFQVEFSGNSAPTAGRLGRPIFEVQRCGKM
jgi:hypothetical protein